jgi:hypothetical protein
MAKNKTPTTSNKQQFFFNCQNFIKKKEKRKRKRIHFESWRVFISEVEK